MHEVTSTWVTRNWAATARMAAHEPVLVRHHSRNSVLIIDESLAAQFFTWMAEQPMPLPEIAERRVANEYQDKRDRELVKLLDAKFGVRRPREWTDAHLTIALGDIPEDRGALLAIAEEYAEVETPWWYKP